MPRLIYPVGGRETVIEPTDPDEIYVPVEEDRDPAAEEQMCMGKGPGSENDLKDPWFEDHTEDEIPNGV